MVHDFIERGSCGSDFVDSSDGDSVVSNSPKLFEILQALKLCATPSEKDLLSALAAASSSIKERDLSCLNAGADCRGGCIRRLLVKYLKLSGYDAAVCSSKWQSSGKVPGGEYEYIDVIFQGNTGGRLIVDTDFRSQFEIARPTYTYVAALKYLPVIFVGSVEKLGQILQVMAEAAKLSLTQNCMPLPPWRTFEYMLSKWMSPYERELIDSQSCIRMAQDNVHQRERKGTKQCVEQLRHLKVCIAAENDKNATVKGVFDGNKIVPLNKSRRSVTGSRYVEKNHVMNASALGKWDKLF